MSGIRITFPTTVAVWAEGNIPARAYPIEKKVITPKITTIITSSHLPGGVILNRRYPKINMNNILNRVIIKGTRTSVIKYISGRSGVAEKRRKTPLSRRVVWVMGIVVRPVRQRIILFFSVFSPEQYFFLMSPFLTSLFSFFAKSDKYYFLQQPIIHAAWPQTMFPLQICLQEFEKALPAANP